MRNKREKWSSPGAEVSSVHDDLWEDNSTGGWEVIRKASLNRNVMNYVWGMLDVKNNGKSKEVKADYLHVTNGFKSYKGLSSADTSIPFNTTLTKLSFNSCFKSLRTGKFPIFLSVQCTLEKSNIYKHPSHTDSKMCLLKNARLWC